LIDLNQNSSQYTQLPPVTLAGTFTDLVGIPPHATRVNVKFANLSTSGTNIPLLQIGDSGGVVATGYGGDTSTITSAPAASAIASSVGLALSTGVTAATTLNGEVVLTRVTPTGNLWTMSYVGSFQGVGVVAHASSVRGLTNPLDRIRFTTFGAVDTFDGGTFSVSFI
jgi:hypothetical protein